MSFNVLAQLKVENFDNWKKFFEERSDTRKELGSKEAHLFKNSDDPNEALILFEWDNKENAREYMESDDLKKYLQKAGAKIINITYLDELETTT